MIPLLAAALLAATPILPAATNQTAQLRFCDADEADLRRSVLELAALQDVRARVVAVSERFLGVPYELDALGEGPGQPPDEGPRLRWDGADCQTFVETVLAVANASRAEEVLPRLDAIRYEGPPAYAHRHHFFEAQWIPANARRGYVRPVTEAIAGKDAVRHQKEITLAGWKERTVGAAIALPEERAPLGRFPLSYVPLAKVLAVAPRIPSGTLFAVVREDRPRVPTMVTHVGIVVHQRGKTYVRHAGLDLYKQVVDEELAHFVARNATYKKWPVLGLALLEPLDARR